MRIWLGRYRGNVWLLIQRKSEKYYFETSSTWFIHCYRSRWKRRRVRLSNIDSFDFMSGRRSLTIHTNFPPEYKRSWQRGWYIEGDRIYYHQVREIMVRIYRKK